MAHVTENEQLIQEMVAIVVQEVKPEAVILFGSHATGKARLDSDVDFLVVERSPFSAGKDRRKEMTRLWRALSKFPIAKDILVYSLEEVEHWRNARNHIIASALREGRFLYGRL